MTDKLLGLKEELVELENKEMELDQHFSWAKQSIFNITDDPFNKSVAFVKHDDFLNAFNEKTILILQGPSGTQLEVLNPTDKQDDKRKYQIHLKSKNGPVNVLYVNTDANANEFSNENAEPAIEVMEIDEQSDSDLEIVKEDFNSSKVNSNHDEAIRTPASKRQKTSDKSINEKQPTPTITPDSSTLRRLSPRKAASQHLFVQSKRSTNQQSQLEVEKKQSTPTPTATAKTTPLNRRNSAKQLTTNSTSKNNDKQEDKDEFANIENNKPVQKTAAIKRNANAKLAANNRILNEDNIRPDIHQPLLRLSPPPNGRDYCFNLDVCEGALDLFGSQPLIEQNK